MSEITEEALLACRAEYRVYGVARLRGVFNRNEINLLRKSALHALTQLPEISNAGYRHAPLETVRDADGHASPALVFWPCLANKALDGLRVDARLQSVVTAILGPDVKQLNNQFYYRLPGDSDSFAWHQDIMFRHPLDTYPRIVEDDGYLQTAIVVDEMNASNAPIIFIQGSNHFGDMTLHAPGDYSQLRGFARDKLPPAIRALAQVEMHAQPGDLLVWSSLTVHGSEANRSDAPRMYYMNGFARAKNSHGWPSYCRDGRIAPLDATLIP